MGKFVFDFDLDVWLRNVEVEANSLEEAQEKLYSMSIEEMIESGYVKDTYINDLDVESGTIEVKAYNIEYDTDEDEIDTLYVDEECYVDVDYKDFSEDPDAAVIEAVSDYTGYKVKSCDYKVN